MQISPLIPTQLLSRQDTLQGLNAPYYLLTLKVFIHLQRVNLCQSCIFRLIVLQSSVCYTTLLCVEDHTHLSLNFEHFQSDLYLASKKTCFIRLVLVAD